MNLYHGMWWRPWNPVKRPHTGSAHRSFLSLIKFFLPCHFSFVLWNWRSSRSCSRQWLYSWMIYSQDCSGHREWRRCLNSLRIMKIKRAIFLLEPATAAAIEWRIVMPLKTCAHVLFRMMDIVSIKRGLPFHRCANGFLTNKIGQSLRLHKKEWVKHFTQLSEHTAARCVNHGNLFTFWFSVTVI